MVSSCTFYEYPVYLIHSVSLVNIIIGIGAEKKVFFSHLICNKITFKNVKLTKTLCFHSPPKLHQPSDSIVLSIHNLQTIEIHYSYILVYSSIKIRSFPSTKVANITQEITDKYVKINLFVLFFLLRLFASIFRALNAQFTLRFF